MDVLFIHFIATWFLVGLIWFVQIVHYPLFNQVGKEGFAEYERRHTNRTTWVVLPPMFIELVTGIWICFPDDGLDKGLAAFGLVLIVSIWISTFFLQVPQHNLLMKGFDEDAYKRLVLSNWIRTLLWTMRGLFLSWVIYEPIPPFIYELF